MEITKSNDILVATINNPNSTTYDMLSAKLTPDNTSLFSKDDYKNSPYVQETFKGADGKFDDILFNSTYAKAASHFQDMTDEKYLGNIMEMEYSPFDITRPLGSKTFKVDVEFAKDYNPFKNLYSRTAINSIDQNNLSLRELAQQEKVFDPKTNTWSTESANDLGLLNKFFGETLVYGQYDTDGTHKDPISNQIVNHKKGDWKISDNGTLFLEKLGDREVYGKQVVNPMDMLTSDGSFANSFDFFDSDSREKSAAAITLKLATEIAPFLIPGVGTVYTGVRVAVGLASVLPTFYKSLEGMLLGDTKTDMTDTATMAENYMAKFATSSISDEAQGSLFNYEQLGQMTADIFAQIYEQRAMASLAKYFNKAGAAKLAATEQEYVKKINSEVVGGLVSGKIDIKDAGDLAKAAMQKLPALAAFQKSQSNLAKSLSLGYMALTSTGDIYGQAMIGGYDRRTAGFASLAAMAGQYGIMMNNRMGDWFLDKSTGYTTQTNKALVRKSVMGYLEPIKTAFATTNTAARNVKLASAFKSIKNSLYDTFTNPSELGEALMKNAFIEGVEEVTEQMVLDATTGIVDTMSYLGLTPKPGSFNTVENVFSMRGLETYVANLLGGVMGGAMFEFHRSRLEPWLKNNPITPSTEQSIYQFVANGQTQLLIDEINKQRSRLGNAYLSPFSVEGEPVPAESGKSQADIIADTAINMIKDIDGIMNANGLAVSDNEIIKKAMLDSLIVKDLEKSKGDGKIGIEGIILDDWHKYSAEFLRVNKEIQKLSITDEDKVKNKEAVSLLKDEIKLYKTKLEDIKEGKNAEQYFTKALFYLAKSISEPYLKIDRNEFSVHTYGKEYQSLPEAGYGITKEKVNKEWEEYTKSTDLRKHIETATNTYLGIEQLMTSPIEKYSKSGYSEERKKTVPNLLDIYRTLEIFDTSDTSKAATLSNYIKMAKEVEATTGKRIIPWDVVTTDLADKILSEGLLSSTKLLGTQGNIRKVKAADTYLNEEIVIDDKPVKRIDIIKNLLNNVLSMLPADNVIYERLANEFNGVLSDYNLKLEEKIEKLAEEKTPENEIETNAKIQDLEKQKLSVRLDQFEESDTYNNQKILLEPNILVKQAELQLSDDTVRGLTVMPKELSSKNFENYQSILASYAKTINKEVSELTDEEKVEALSEIIAVYNTMNPNNVSLSDILNGDSADKFTIVENIVDNFIINLEASKVKYKEYIDFRNKEYSKIKQPEIFGVHSYVIEAIIKEIKSSKNLDKELVIKLDEMYMDLIGSLKNKYFKNWIISNTDFLDLLQNADQILNDLATYDAAIMAGEISEVVFPKYMQTIIDSIEDKYDVANVTLALSEIVNDITPLQKTIKKLVDLKEILDNKDKFISNSIYDFLENLELTLNDQKVTRKKSVLKVLRDEELSLLKASEITNYQSEGIRDADIQQTLNFLKIAKSVVFAMQTTDIGFDDLYGFIFSRQEFAKKYKLDSDVTKLKTITSDLANLMLGDINRIETKLKFLLELSKSNSGQIFNEQEIIRNKTNGLLLNAWKELTKADIKIQEKPLIPDLSDILSSNDSTEKKLLNIEEAFYKHYKGATKGEKLEVVKLLSEKYNYINILDKLYNIDGSDEISKDIKQLSKSDLLLYFTSSLAISSKDFNNKLLKILKTAFNKAPFYTQELHLKITYASIVDMDLFAELIKDNAYEANQLTEYITYILGNAGTGKTTVLFRMLIEMLKDNNPNLSMWFSAPHADQASKLFTDVTKDLDISKFTIKTHNKQQLFEALGITQILEDIENFKPDKISKVDKPGDKKLEINFENIVFNNIPTNLPNLIFIDEVTHFDATELTVMNELVKRAAIETNDVPGQKIKIIAAGDPTQNGKTNKHFEGNSYNVDRVSGIFPPQLTLTVRAQNSQKRKNNDSLAGLTKKAIKVFEDPGTDTQKVLDLIDKGIVLKYFLDKDRFNGDFLTDTDQIPKEVLTTLKTIIDRDSTIKIGILSKGLDLNPALRDQLNNAGITESSYKLYTEATVQGSELDYFILPVSLLSGKHIVSSIKKLNTYATRAKHGTLIVNDGIKENTDKTKLLFNNGDAREDYTEEVQPLKDELIQQSKNTRIEALTQLLSPDFNINDTFTFDTNTAIILDEEEDDNIFKEPEVISGDTFEGEVAKTIIKDDYKYMVHTFYNDLNVKVEIKGNQVTLTKNNSQPYGLDFLFDTKNPNTVTIPLEEYKVILNQLVDFKYKLWKSKNNSKGDQFRVPADNDFIKRLLGRTYKVSEFTSELVIRKSTYLEDFNKPVSKELDVKEEHLKDNDINLDIFLKLKIKDSIFYIHLGALPKLSTVQSFFNEQLKDPNNKTTKAYETFLESGVEETVIDSSQIEVITSTRLVKDSDNKTKYTLNQLSELPGIKFFNGSTFSSKISYNLFPAGDAGFNIFKDMYKRTTFGSQLSEEKLKEMYYGKVVNGKVYPGYKGKPYAAISFVEDTSQVQYILLKSSTRKIKELKDLIKNPFGTKEAKSAQKLIMDSSEDALARKKIDNFTNSLFSGSQVLDMLISLAIEKPVIFNEFFETGEHILKESAAIVKNNPAFVKKYIKAFGNMFQKDLIGQISYAGGGIRKVLEYIQQEVAKTTKSGTPLNEKTVRKNLLEAVKGEKLWFTKFWNLLSFRNNIDTIISNPEVLDALKDQYTEFGKTIDSMLDFWEYRDIYYNVPITKHQGSEGKKYELSKAESDLDNLYITLIPEGPRILVDLSKEVTFNNAPVVVSNAPAVDPKIEQLKNKLASITFGGEIIIPIQLVDLNVNNPTTMLGWHIGKAQIIKSILEHPQNSNPIVDGMSLENLRTFDRHTTLEDKVKLLNSRVIGKSIEDTTRELNVSLQSLIVNEPDNYSSKEEFINNFINQIQRFIDGKTDPTGFNDADRDTISQIVSKINSKVFSGMTLVEYLNQLPTTVDEIASTNEDWDSDLITEDLTSFVYNQLGIIPNIKGIYSQNLFSNCT